MDALRGLLHRLRVLLRGEDYAREVDEEMRFHLSLDTENRVRDGVDPHEAAVEARRQFGSSAYMKEEVRYAAGTRTVDAWAQDARYALRSLRRAPAFVILAVLTLAIGIGSSTAVFSVMDAIVLRGLPYRDVDRLAAIYEVSDNGRVRTPSYPTFADWETQAASFGDAVEGLAYVRGDGIKVDDDPERRIVAYVSPGFFELAGTRPALGRVFAPDEEKPDAPHVAVISWSLFLEVYGGDPAVVGRTVRLNGAPVAVIGVMPHAFALPNFAGSAWLMPSVWRPIEPLRPTMPQLALRGLHVDSRTLVRLKPGADSASVAAAMRTVQSRLAAEHPIEQAHWTSVAIQSVSDQVYGTRRQQMTMIFGAVALVLLLACMNITNLFLVRASVRSRELAVRVALGASRLRVARQLFLESLVMALSAGAAGMLIAALLLGVARRSASQLLPFISHVGLDARAVAFTLVVSLLAALITGLLPAIRAGAGALMLRLRSGGGTGGGDRAERRVRHAVVSLQLAVTVTLLIGAGLLLQSFRRVASVSLGFEAQGLIELAVRPPSPAYDSPEAAAALYRRIMDRLRAMPGVSDAAAAGGALIPVAVRRPDVTDDARTSALYHPVSSEYLAAMRIPLREGRWFGAEDMRAASGFVVNETLARQLAPSGSALGTRVTVRRSSQARRDFGQEITLPVIGVVGDTRLSGPEGQVQPELLLPYTLEVWPWMRFAVRASSAATLLHGVERAVKDVEPGIEFFSKPSLAVAGSAAVDRGRRFITLVLAGFAGAALVLACVGLYGIVAYGVEQRRRELGVRIALGATTGGLVGAVMRDALVSLAGGMILGTAGAYLTMQSIRGMLFETSPTDPGALGAVLVVLSSVTVLASYVPARRATRVDPMLAMRTD